MSYPRVFKITVAIIQKLNCPEWVSFYSHSGQFKVFTFANVRSTDVFYENDNNILHLERRGKWTFNVAMAQRPVTVPPITGNCQVLREKPSEGRRHPTCPGHFVSATLRNCPVCPDPWLLVIISPLLLTFTRQIQFCFHGKEDLGSH